MKMMQRRPAFVWCMIVLSVAVLCVSCPVSAWESGVSPISTNNYMDISTANDGGYYVGFRCAGGGLNALHITTSTSDPYGQVSTVSSDSGTFYIADTGGRGYFDRTLLMVAIKVPEGGEDAISDDLKIHIKASGYRWVSEGIKDQPPDEENITYVTDSIDRTFGLSSIQYGPQSWKPAGEEDHPIMYGQSSSDEFYLFFVDTGVGALGRNSGITGLTNNGMAKIDYKIENYNGETVVFNVYGYALWADAVKDGIAWTNKIGGTTTDKNARTSANGYSVILASSGGDSEFGNETPIDYGDSDGGDSTESSVSGWVPSVGNLNITSIPTGAAVYLDGVDTGEVTNASFMDIPEGEYTIRLELPGYAPLERAGVPVKKGYLTTRNFNLTLAKGSCTVLSDVRGARIFIDGNETLCYANWTFDDIQVGNHTISLEKDGYDPVSREVVINDTNTTVIFLNMSGSTEEKDSLVLSGDSASSIGTNASATETVTIADETTSGEDGQKESPGLFDLIFSMIAGLWGEEQSPSQSVQETSTAENISWTPTVPKPDVTTQEKIVENDTKDRTDTEAVHETQIGNVYVTSYPSGANIFVDGSDTGYTTPHLIYGVKSGVHTIKVKAHSTHSASQIEVPAGESTVADFNLADNKKQQVSVNVTSKEAEGGHFSLNGESLAITLPTKVMVDSFGSYLTYKVGDYYCSRTLPALEGGESIVLEKGDEFGEINVTSTPEGAEVYLDGIRTGCETPCTIDNVSEGYHKLMVTKASNLPIKREIFLVNSENEIDMTQNFVLENIATGRLVVTSDPADCKVYLRGVYTGETTPCTFENVPIGTYNVGVMVNRTLFKDRDVTVLTGGGNTTVDFQLEG